MDLGVFRRTKWRLSMWILGPVALLAILFSSFNTFYRAAEKQIGHQTAVMNILPQMDRHLQAASNTIRRFTFGQTGLRALNGVNTEITEAAQHAAVALNAINAQKSATNAFNELLSLQLTVKGDGNLQSITRFIQEIQHPFSLATTENVKLKTSSLAPDAAYTAELTLNCYAVAASPGEGKLE
jgi:hypothetical protein